jgi:hypothetical protein
MAAGPRAVPGGVLLTATDRAVLARMRAAVDSREKDWPKFARQAVHFHLKNAASWANAATGHALEAQVDPNFVLGPPTRVAAGQGTWARSGLVWGAHLVEDENRCR